MKKNGKKAVLALLMAAMLLFIWSNSMLNAEESSQVSSRATEILRPILSIFVGSENVTDHLVRKMGHFTEFAILGVITALLFAEFAGKKNVQYFMNCLFAAFTAAVIDETVQIFSHRGSSLADVWLDFAGALLGCTAIRIACFAAERKKKK